MDEEEKLADNEVRRKVITIRKQTRTRPALRIVISQTRDEKGNTTLPIISISRPIDTYIESPRYASDVSDALKVAAYFAEDWSQYVNGKK